MEIGPWAQDVPNCQFLIGNVVRKCAFQRGSRNHGNGALGPDVPRCQFLIGNVLRKCTFQGRSRNHGNRALGPGRPELSILNRKCNKEMCVSEEVPRSWKLGPGPRTSQSVRF